MPWGFGGGPWWAYNPRDLGRYWGYWWRCWRYPWLPRGWWAYPPDYWQQELTPKEEKEMLLEDLKALKEEMKAIEERLKELESKKGKK